MFFNHLVRNFSISVLIISLVLYYSCKSKNEITDVRVNSTNGLRATITFKTSLESECIIKYSEENSDEIMKSLISGYGTDHSIILLNLKPNTIYEYAILTTDTVEPVKIDRQLFKTSNLSKSLPRLDLVVDEGDVFDGLILVRKIKSPGVQMLINNQGRIVWYHEFNTVLFRPFSWTQKENILGLENEDRIREFDLGGNTVFLLEYGQKGFSKLLHHEIFRDNQGNILSLTRNYKVFDLSSIGGEKADTVKGDGILVLDSIGNKIWEWDMFNNIHPMDDPDLLLTKDDWSHANSLSIDNDGNYLVSFRNFNQVWCVSAKSGEIIWKLGKGGDFKMDTDDYFFQQHAAYINQRGELMLFDNGDNERKYSRAISFKLDTSNFTAKSKIKVNLPDSLYSFKMGSAYLIDKDKVLFSCTIPFKIVITDLNGQILWQLNTSEAFYRALYIDEFEL